MPNNTSENEEVKKILATTKTTIQKCHVEIDKINTDLLLEYVEPVDKLIHIQINMIQPMLESIKKAKTLMDFYLKNKTKC